VVFVDRRSVYWGKRSQPMEAKRLSDLRAQIFLVLMPVHFARLTYKLIVVKAEKRMTAFSPIFLRSSCSGSAAQWRKVTTSLAIWEVVAGVPGGGGKQLFGGNELRYLRNNTYHHRVRPVRQKGHAPSKWRHQGRMGYSSFRRGFRRRRGGQGSQ